MAISVSSPPHPAESENIGITGNGIVVHNDGLLSTVSLVGVAPLRIDSPDGIDGSPLLRAEAPNYPLGQILRADLTVTDDQVIPINMATAFVIRRIVITGTSQTPVGVTASIYTMPSAGGIKLVDAQSLDPLTSRNAMVEVVPVAQRLETPFLYLRLSSAVEIGAVDIYVFGDALRPLED